MKIIAQNRKAYHNYFIEEEIDAGIILMGSEVKSIRNGKVNINDAYCLEISGNIYLLNAYVSEHKGAILFCHQPRQNRQLLLHKKQIQKIIGKIKTKGVTLVPLSIYLNDRNIVKIKIGVAKGKKLYDKRQSIKERDQDRQAQRDVTES